MLIRTRTRTTKWNFFFHYSTIVFNIIIGVVLVPLYLKFIPADLYGAWLATGNLLFWLGVLDPGFSQVILQRISFYYGKAEYSLVGNYAFYGILIGIIISIMIGILGIYFYYNFTSWLNLKNLSGLNELKYAFLLSLSGTCIMMFSFSIISINQGLQSSLGIGFIYLFANISSIGLTIFLFYTGFGIKTLGWVALVRGLIYLIGNIFYLLYRLYHEKIQVKYTNEIKKDFTSLISYNFLGKLGNTIYTQVNSFFIARMLGTTAVSVLKFSQSAPEISKLFLVRPAIAISPALTHLIGEGDLIKSQKVLLRLIYFTVWGLGIAFMGFILFNGPFISLWVGNAFFGGSKLNLIICILMILTTLTEVQSALVFSLGDIKKNNIIILIQSILFLIIITPSIKYFGLNGVIFSSIISNLLFSFWYYPYSFYKISGISLINIKPLFYELIKVFLISILLIIVFDKMKISNWFDFFKTVCLSIFCYFILVLIVSKPFRSEIISLKQNYIA